MNVSGHTDNELVESGSIANRTTGGRTTSIRVLAVIPSNPVGNSFIFVRRQISSIKRRGVQVREFYLGSRTAPFKLLRDWWRLKRVVREFRPDIIHAHYGTATGALCALTWGSPRVITFRGSDLQSHLSVNKVRGWASILLSQGSVLRASRVICVSQGLRDRLWWGRGKAVVVPSGVDLDLFHPVDRDTARATVGWGLQEDVVLFCGGAHPKAKGLELARSGVEYAEKWNMPIRFFNLDGTTDPKAIPLYLNAADCLVFTSLREGSPNIIKEAMACNLPIVSVAVGDVPERLRGVSCSQVVGRSASEVGAAVHKILKMKRRSDGRAKVLDCSEEIISETLCQLYGAVSSLKNS